MVREARFAWDDDLPPRDLTPLEDGLDDWDDLPLDEPLPRKEPKRRRNSRHPDTTGHRRAHRPRERTSDDG